MKQTLNMRQQLSINLRYCYSSSLEEPHKICWRPAIRLPTCLTASSSHCLTTLPAKGPAFDSYITCGKTHTTVQCCHSVVMEKY